MIDILLFDRIGAKLDVYEKLNQYYKMSIYTHVIARDKRTIVCNTGNGMFVRMPTECWEVVQSYLEDYTPQEVCNAANIEDQEYYKEIYLKLLEAKLLVLLDEEHLDEVYLIITNRCNLRCVHCCAEAEELQGEDPLSTNEWLKIIDKLIEQNVNRLVITGGEPLVRNDFFEILDYLKENFNGQLILSTNGLLITENNVKKIAKSFDAISISVDGYDEDTCSQIRGKGVFSKVISNINLLKNIGYNPQSISLSMVDTVVTHDGIELFEKLCNNLDIKPIVRTFSAVGRGKSSARKLQILETGPVHGVYTENEDVKKRLDLSCMICQNCNAGRTKLSINQYGDIFPCAVLDSKEYCLGNILKDSDILPSLVNLQCEKYKSKEKNKGLEAFNKLLIKNNEKCSKCDVAPFCVMCLETFIHEKEKYGLNGICNANKEFLSEVIGIIKRVFECYGLGNESM